MVSKPSSTHYTEVVEVALETSFQGLEIANATYVKKRKIIPKFQPSRASMMVAKVMLENGYHYGGDDNKTQISPKIITTSSRWFGGSKKNNLPPYHLLLFICSHE